jgi:thioredoxin 1
MSDLVRHISDADFESAIAAGATLVDFWAPWCGPCKAIAPLLDELAGGYEGRLQVAKLNIDENQDVASRFGVMSIPTLIVFRDGQKVAQKVGAGAKASLKEFIEQSL